MTVFRVEKTRDYTVMSNCHLRDKRLTLKAKGLMSFMLSLPDDWDYTIKGMAALHPDGIDSIRTALNELEEYGYMVRARRRDAGGRLRDTEYVIYESPRLDLPILENPTQAEPILENPTQVFPTQENPTQRSTKGTSTKESNTNLKKNEEKKALGRYGNVRLSDSELESLGDEFPEDLDARIERLGEYMESSGRSYKSHAATIRSWAARDAERAASPTKLDYRCDDGECL
ncbi:helix-turn-helix domain-containing protein [Paraeggerthella hongkongensis]|uniref:helix-turn-helix domain-containing protein n=1 Tax=Paraeggerthella hominis TaxID=2897351 RepID=UPI001C0F734C|nr:MULTISPECIES: helix-turn-helix domain-containing protein [Paraeggerthella]MBU5406504.1 helix-turn-helix domain-containing protein [Paraeggerthella hongkongensis]MCD2434270.1 helix-turn-helix domain-containing protein [Paraeggerthella hominis]